MKVAFLVGRANYFRLFAPVIDEALKRGWDVECWRDGARPGKGDVAADHTPAFVHGKPAVLTYGSVQELEQWLADRRPHCVLSLATAASYFPDRQPSSLPVWLCLQNSGDLVYHNSPQGLLDSDLTAFYSPWWIKWMAENFFAERRVSDASGFEAALAAKSAIVGFPELDAASRIDPAEVRDRWGIPAGRPVVLLVPFPQGVGKEAFWPRKVFTQPNALRQTLSLVAHRRFEYWPHVRNRWTEAALSVALRAFCDRSGALLVVKSRRKTPIPAYLARVADKCLYDESFYPATILEALSIADLCISFYSAAVTEAVALNVPHLCVAFEMEDYFDVDLVALERSRRWLNPTEGGLFQFSGVSRTITVAGALEFFRTASLGDCSMDAAARTQYVTKFLGYDDRCGSVRTLNALERACA
jgi:hypothetical protein